jgi:hypothetical protein
MEAADGGAEGGELDGDLLDLCGGGLASEGCVGAWVKEKEPGTGIAGEDGFNALAIEPAGCFDGRSAADGRDVGIDEAAQTMGYACGYAGKAGAGGGEDDGGAGCASEGFECGGVGCITRLGKGFAGDG